MNKVFDRSKISGRKVIDRQKKYIYLKKTGHILIKPIHSWLRSESLSLVSRCYLIMINKNINGSFVTPQKQ